ncbi:MAG TPA: universal stress protein [Burkholderiales bacterium]|nr:universal stress protein [Burkholderiales bacterium]
MRILVPVDGSAGALRAVKHAAAHAARGTQLQLVNVQPPMPLYGMVRAYMHESQYRQACAILAQKALAPAVRLAKRARVAHRAHVLYGEAGGTIAGAARRLKCGGIVMGTRGQGAVGNLILGSVATKVIHLAKVPVTLVK